MKKIFVTLLILTLIASGSNLLCMKKDPIKKERRNSTKLIKPIKIKKQREEREENTNKPRILTQIIITNAVKKLKAKKHLEKPQTQDDINRETNRQIDIVTGKTEDNNYDIKEMRKSLENLRILSSFNTCIIITFLAYYFFGDYFR